MEINAVPRFDGKDARGVSYSKIPELRFPVDSEGRSRLVQGVTCYSKAALYDAFKAWRDGGPPPAFGSLVRLDPALLVTPPRGLEAGHVPIVTPPEGDPPMMSRGDPEQNETTFATGGTGRLKILRTVRPVR